MPPLKTSLFLLYCLASVILIGTAFSNFWRASRLLAKEQVQIVRQQPADPADTTAQLENSNPNQSQS